MCWLVHLVIDLVFCRFWFDCIRTGREWSVRAGGCGGLDVIPLAASRMITPSWSMSQIDILSKLRIVLKSTQGGRVSKFLLRFVLTIGGLIKSLEPTGLRLKYGSTAMISFVKSLPRTASYLCTKAIYKWMYISPHWWQPSFEHTAYNADNKRWKLPKDAIWFQWMGSNDFSRVWNKPEHRMAVENPMMTWYRKPIIPRVFRIPNLSKCRVLIVRGGEMNIVHFAEDTVGSGITCWRL